MAPRTTEVHEMGLLTPDQYQSSVSESEGRKQSPWYTRHGWLLEILSMVASLCCTLTLAFLLFKVQDKPYEDWKFYVGLNPTISTLTTVARGTLLLSASACLSQGKWLHFVKRSQLQALDVFDQASRGPLGALKIVLKTKTYLGLPTLAAAITVLALAIGPFAQQVVDYDQGNVPTKSQRASYDYAHDYASGAPMFSKQVSLTAGLNGPTDDNVDSDMQGAIYRGLYQNRDSWTPSFSCPSNCTWADPQIILGFAGMCENVTISTLATKDCVVSEDNSAMRNCRMTTPGGVHIDTVVFDTVYETVSALNATITKPGWQATNPVPGPEIATYAIYDSGKDGLTHETIQEKVWECSLTLTAYKYSAVSSVSNEFEIGETETIPLESGQADQARRALIFNQSGIPELSVSSRDLGALKGFFQSALFTGSRLQGESRPTPQLGCNPAFMSNNASEVTAKLAKSMTDALQRNNASQQYTGSYAQSVTYVRVSWVWLILLGALEAAGLVLLVGTIIRARLEDDALLWKSSQSALLFSHIDSDGSIVPPKQSVKELEKMAETTKTQLLKV